MRGTNDNPAANTRLARDKDRLCRVIFCNFVAVIGAGIAGTMYFSFENEEYAVDQGRAAAAKVAAVYQCVYQLAGEVCADAGDGRCHDTEECTWKSGDAYEDGYYGSDSPYDPYIALSWIVPVGGVLALDILYFIPHLCAYACVRMKNRVCPPTVPDVGGCLDDDLDSVKSLSYRDIEESDEGESKGCWARIKARFFPQQEEEESVMNYGAAETGSGYSSGCDL